MAKRKPRNNEITCNCRAYHFPHRLTGGKCNGISWVEDYWESHWGAGDCEECILCDKDDGLQCQVVNGQESSSECRAFQEYIRYNEVKVYHKRK